MRVVTDDKHYHDIGEAIREKNGTETQYKPSEMADAVRAIESGGGGADDAWEQAEYAFSNGFTKYNSYFADNNVITEVPAGLLRHTSSATKFSSMFSGCNELTSAPQFDTSSGTNFNYMFNTCYKLTSIPQLNTSSGTSFAMMFGSCKKLTTIPQLDTSSGTDFSSMFSGCTELTEVPQLDTSSGTAFNSMFSSCAKLTTIPQLDTSSGTAFSSMFRLCKALITIGGIDLSNATLISTMFDSCSKLENITINGVIKITGLSFSPCTKLTHTSLMSIINALYDHASAGSTGTYTLTLGSTNLAKLTDAEKAIATQKGWTLA